MHFDTEKIKNNDNNMLELGAGVLRIKKEEEDSNPRFAGIVGLLLLENSKGARAVEVTFMDWHINTYMPDPQNSLSINKRRGIISFSLNGAEYTIREIEKRDTVWLVPASDKELEVQELAERVLNRAYRTWR